MIMDLTNAYNVIKYGLKKAGTKLVQWGKEAPRMLLGALFLFTGLNAFFSFYQPPEPSTASINFLMGLNSAVYFFPLLKLVEVLCGFLLVVKRYTVLALTMLAPIVVNIVAFHVYLDPVNYFFAALSTALYCVVVWQNRNSLKCLLVK